MTCSGEGLANVKWNGSFASSRITEQNLIWHVKTCNGNSFPFPQFYSHSHTFIRIPIWHCHSHGNSMALTSIVAIPMHVSRTIRRRLRPGR